MKYKTTIKREQNQAHAWTPPSVSSFDVVKLLRFSLLSMLVMLCGGLAQAADPDVTYDFTSGWTVSNGTLSDGTVSFTGQGDDNFKMNTGYFMMGKSGAYINFPTCEKAVSKIVITGRSGASGSVKKTFMLARLPSVQKRRELQVPTLMKLQRAVRQPVRSTP